MDSDIVLVEDKNGNVMPVIWPMCSIPGCKNRQCLRLNSKYCWPHTKGDKSFDNLMGEIKESEVIA